MSEQDYILSVVDSDGDKLLESAPLRAASLQSAWEQGIVIAFRVCRGSGALPTTISVGRPSTMVPPASVVEMVSDDPPINLD